MKSNQHILYDINKNYEKELYFLKNYNIEKSIKIQFIDKLYILVNMNYNNFINMNE
jgi:hypothetical protein